MPYLYDSLGRRQTVADDSGTTTYGYDVNGNLIQEVTPEGTINYVYNSLNQHVETWTGTGTDPSAATTRTDYGYDSLGRLTTVTALRLDGSTLSAAAVTAYAYDAAGNLAHETLPNGVIIDYTYDTLNRLTGEKQTKGATTLYSVAYTLRPDGTRSGATEQELQPDNSTTAIITSARTYDALDRLTGETVTSSLSGGSYVDTYTYDLDGNRVGMSHVAGGTTQTTTYSYNGDNELTSQTAGSTTTTFTYDANGSQLTSTTGSNVTTYTYDVRNRLSSVTSGGVTTTYGYDNSGNRVSETTSGTTTYYLIDPNNPTGYAKPIEVRTSTTGSFTGSTLSMSYILGLDVIGQADSNGAVTYLLKDGKGDTRALVNSSGVVMVTFNFDAFGNVLGVTYTAANPPPTIWLLGDAMFDAPSGLELHGSGRPGNSSIGRFIIANPPEYSSIDDPLSLNTYILDNADPVNNDDPTGWFTQAFGYLAEAAIEQVYAMDHPGQNVGYGGWTRLGIPGGPAFRLKPDIFNTTTKRWAEIKPLSPSGIAKAGIQFGVYTAAFAPFGYFPDVGWTPSTHYAIAGTVPILFFNAGGIIFYTDVWDNAEDLIALGTLGAVRAFAASPFGQRLITQSLIYMGERIPQLVKLAIDSIIPELETELGVGLITD